VALLAVSLLLAACASRRPVAAPQPPPPPAARELDVTAHAYTSSVAETDAQPTLAASGERLRPGMRALAVSPDLLAMGIDYGTRVSVNGLGEWIVLDRMGDEHRRAIDLYMGEDRDAARRFGKRRVRIRWGDP
jgi:3D (Asp-Asp-Asp) domain-containing protein